MAVPPLRALVDARFEVALVVTRADARRGRRAGATPSPVKSAALQLGLPVAHDLHDAAVVGADLGVVVAYGRILPVDLLAELPMVNLHFSLLPRWRGAAPVERAIMAGDAETGVCLMQVTEGLDEGDVFDCAHLPLEATSTAASVRQALVASGTELLVRHLSAGLPQSHPQTGEPTYAHKLTTEDLRLDWSRPAVEVDRVVRVGGAWTTVGGARLKVWEAAPSEVEPAGPPGTLVDNVVVCGTGALELREVQPEGRPRQASDAWQRGARLAPGTRLGS
jgi:methionyl-tRNA formyltransferase